MFIDDNHVNGDEFKVIMYRLLRLTFGLNSCPFSLSATIKQHLSKFKKENPVATEILNSCIYVDDLIAGTDTVQDALNISQQSHRIMKEANMTFRKWISNDELVMESWEKNGFSTLPQAFEENKTHKVLGLLWQPKQDMLMMEIDNLLEFLCKAKNTKRFVLQVAGRIFDPLGLISPFTIRIKRLFQELWSRNLTWDEELPHDISKLWEQWCSELPQLAQLKIPRNVLQFPEDSEYKLILHTFADASPRAYGAVIYLQTYSKTQSSINLLTSKSRVAPLKKVSLLRLELLGALLAARLTCEVKKVLDRKGPFSMFLWTDSQIALYWIKGSANRWKSFVSNRVKEIQSLTDPSRWFHCGGSENPTDLLTRAAVVYVRLHGFFFISYLRNFTVVDYFHKNVQRIPNETCFMCEDEEWTYKQVDDLSNKVAHYFLKQGFQRGDEVALLMENCPDYVCIWLGLAKIGVVTALINTNQKTESFSHSMNIIDMKALIYGESFAEAVENALPYIRRKEDFYCYQRKSETKHVLQPFSKLLNSFLENMPSTPLNPQKFKTNFEDKFLYIYTSGTTGFPKAAVIKHRRCLYIIAATKYVFIDGGFQTYYNSLPLYHVSGGLMCLGIVLIFGGKMVIRKKFSASNFWKDAVKYKATVCQYIGEICRYLLNQPKVPEETQHSIQIMIGNGIKPHIWEEFQDRFNIKKISEFYGMTEGNINIGNIFGKVGACGFISRIFFRIHALHLIKLNPETGEVVRDSNGLCVRCKPGEPGELMGKIANYSPLLAFDGYANSADNTKKIISDCFRKGDKAFASGDIMVMDEDGYLYFKDRSGDTFRWRGENVSTSEVENIISKIMDHASCIVFGVEIPNTEGRAGMAVIQADAKSVDLKKFHEAITERLPSYAVPIFIRFSSNIEVTGTHKFQKTKFKEEGYNLKDIYDPLYVLDFNKKAYVPLTQEMHHSIKLGKIKL